MESLSAFPICRYAVYLRSSLAVFMLLSSVACSLLPTAESQMAPRTYILAPTGDDLPTEQNVPERTVILVTPVESAGYSGRQMAYTKRAYELEFFAHNEWADVPARMLTVLLTQRLEDSGAFTVLTGNPSASMANLRLDTRILNLHQEFDRKPSQVRVTLRVQLVDLTRRAVLTTRSFEALVSAPSDDAYGGVVAINQALGSLLREVVDLCAMFAKRSHDITRK